MKFDRNVSALLGFGIAAFLTFPIVLTSYGNSHHVSVNLPSLNSRSTGASIALTPISARKAQAVHEFKLAQL
jgi:hypothetical protein